jgi:hypothetical protein
MFLAKNAHKLRTATNIHRPVLASTQQRDYFSVFEKVKERFSVPLKHIQSFTEPDGQNLQSQMPEGYRLHGNSAASFSASMT